MKTQCPNCKAKFNVNDKFAGKQAKCPKCNKPFTIEPFTETPAAALNAEHAEKAPNFMLGVNPQDKPGGLPVPTAGSTSKRALSKTVFVYCWMAVRIVAGVLAALGLMLAIRKEAHSILIAAFAAADVFLVCSVLIELALFYKMWAVIPDREASISPVKAVGFLFIPVFNIYWALLMITGFAEDYNSFIKRRAIKAKDLPMSLFLIYAFVLILSATVVTTPMICVFAFVGLISRAFIGYPLQAWLLFSFVFAVGISHFITYILVVIKIRNAINTFSNIENSFNQI